jgi:Predicted O-methyltransferase
MFDLLPQEIEYYCEEHSSPESELLYHLNRETHLKALRPRMISGKIQGGFLSFVSRMMQPQHILELGTYTGYATLCLAEGLKENGRIDTVEIDEEQVENILEYFNKSEYKEQIRLHIGNALEVIPTLTPMWDLVMIDADKQNYIKYYDLILPKLRKGGIILVDNVLWSGKVIEEVKHNDKDTKAIMAFNDYVQQDPNVKNLILPFRDGIMMIEKL